MQACGNILLLEDDAHLGHALRRALEEEGFQVTWARTRQEGALHLLDEVWDLLLLDRGLPDGDGLDLLRECRRKGVALPVLMLTAWDALEDRVRGLDEGADDYLIKPFAMPELFSRIRALLRRSAGFATRLWTFGDLLLDPQASRITLRGEEVHLTTREFQLLLLLARQAGRVVTRRQLEARLFDLGAEPESNTVEVHIHHLRRKLGGTRIRTVRGMGYLLEDA